MSKYAKRHYTDVARIISETREAARLNYAHPAANQAIGEMTRKFLDLFGADNPAFNADKFVDACLKRPE